MLVKLRLFDSWKKIALFLAALSTCVVACSLVFNRPIRFWPKWSDKPKYYSVLHPSGARPDNIVLTPAGDMATMAAVNWRTSEAVSAGVVEYVAADSGIPERRAATSRLLFSRELKSDDAVFCHSATLTGLRPGTTYHYRVGDGASWSGFRTFATAPADAGSFSFVYFGDTQVKPHRFRALLDAAEARHPDTAFHMIGGDLVDRGEVRNLWDELFVNTGHVFSRKPVAPALGNHDFGNRGFGVRVFNSYFNLPGRNDADVNAIANYSFDYGGTSFVVVNRFDPAEEAGWLENELRLADARGCEFKVVMFHHPVYNIRKGRDNPAAREHWVPLFDRYGVDLVLTGHDHAYTRTKSLRGGRPAAPGEPGTTYVIANSCEKSSKHQPLDVAAKQFSRIPTYQLIEIDRSGDGPSLLRYSARDVYGEALDEFVVEKARAASGVVALHSPDFLETVPERFFLPPFRVGEWETM